MERKYFSIEQAERLLPIIKKKLYALKLLQKRINLILELKETMEKTIEITSEEGLDFVIEKEVQINKEFHKKCYEFYKHLDALNRIGCIVKDVNKGLIDFYSKFQGRDVCLCWKIDEERISHWHELNKGAKGRRKIVDLGEKIKIRKKEIQR